jgi:CRP/FNR family cyclic AMP-dependent transcriptional regulator
MAHVGEFAVFLPPTTNVPRELERLIVSQWRRAEWETLFSYMQKVNVCRGDRLILWNATDRALYFVEAGALEVTSVTGGFSREAIQLFLPGSVVGELSFFDGRPRSAEVRAAVDSALHRLDFEAYKRFADAQPRMACDLLFAIGQLIALRLRHTMSSAKCQ